MEPPSRGGKGERQTGNGLGVGCRRLEGWGSVGTKYGLDGWLEEIKGRGPERPQGHNVVYIWVGLVCEGEG